MSNLLIRGLSENVRRKIQKLAKADNLSLNQEVIQLLDLALEQTESKKELEERRAEAFRRIREIREENFRKYGLSDDSVKIIREMRESRSRDLT